MNIFHPNDRLRELRVAKKVSRKQLAASLGISRFTLGRWERGETHPSPNMLKKLCTFFQLSPAELGFIESMSLPPGNDKIGFIASTVDHTEEGTSYSSHSSTVIDPMIPLPVVPGLIGRASTLTKLIQRLFAHQRSVVTVVHGLPGMGKTAMATAVAHDATLREHFADGILWAGLGPHPNLSGVLSRWGKLLGISSAEMSTLTGIEAWSKALRTAIGGRKFLIVIDDAWQVEEALACKVGGENCQHLVTTRFPSLATQLTIDGVMQLQELNEDESIALLEKLAPGMKVEEAARVQGLVRTVGGLPLALTLIGNYLRAQIDSKDGHDEECSEFIQRVDMALQRLEDATIRLHISEPNLPAVSHPSLEPDSLLSLQSIIAVTDQFLSEAARTAFYILSIFSAKPNSFSEEAALAVADCTTDELDILVESGLLECTVGDRYMLHQVIADYAHLHLSDADKERSVMRLITYVIQYIQTHKRTYELLDQESGTIVAALELAYEAGMQVELIRAVCAFAPFLILRGFYSLAEQHLKRAYDVAIAIGDENVLAEVLLYQGEIALKQSNFSLSEKCLEAGLNLATKAGNEECICDLLTDLGSVAWRRGEYAHAEELLQEGLSIARHIKSHVRMERIFKILGSVFANQGNFSRAVKALQDGLVLAQQIDDREQMCVLLGNIGAVLGDQGDATQAEIYFQKGLKLARQVGHREQTCVLLINLGNINKDVGNYTQAEQYFQEGLNLARQIGHSEWVSVLLCNLGSILLQREDTTLAEVYLRESLELARSVGRPQIICNALHEYGYFYLILQQTNLAEDSFREMLYAVPERDRIWYAFAHFGLARVSATKGDVAEAHRFGSISLQVLETIGHVRAQEVKGWLNDI